METNMPSGAWQCSKTGAWVFPPSPVEKMANENAQLKALLGAVVDALPKTAKDKIPAELLEVLNAPPAP